jgi:hypothetical protein
LTAKEDPRPCQAVAESPAALNAPGLWPGPRDEIAEHGLEQIRRRRATV